MIVNYAQLLITGIDDACTHDRHDIRPRPRGTSYYVAVHPPRGRSGTEDIHTYMYIPPRMMYTVCVRTYRYVLVLYVRMWVLQHNLITPKLQQLCTTYMHDHRQQTFITDHLHHHHEGQLLAADVLGYRMIVRTRVPTRIDLMVRTCLRG